MQNPHITRKRRWVSTLLHTEGFPTDVGTDYEIQELYSANGPFYSQKAAHLEQEGLYEEAATFSKSSEETFAKGKNVCTSLWLLGGMDIWCTGRAGTRKLFQEVTHTSGEFQVSSVTFLKNDVALSSNSSIASLQVTEVNLSINLTVE